MNRVKAISCVSCAFLALTSVVTGQTTLLFDDFEDGDFTSSPTWYNIGTQHTASVIDDSAGLGTGNAAKLDYTLVSGSGSSFFHAEFPEVTLGQVGDYVELTFDIRIDTPDHDTKPNLLRFGLYDTNGTSAAENLAQDGFGYFAQADVGARVPSAAVELRRNRLVSMFNATFNPDQFGQDAGLDEYAVTFDDPHSILFRIERTEDPFDQNPDLLVTVNLKGPGEEDNADVSATVLFKTGIIDTFTFGDVNIGTRANSNTFGNDDFIVDNVMVTTNLDVEIGVEGDFDGDDDVDGRDFLAWQRGQSPSPLSSSDLADWQTNYGSGSPLASATAVPEPSGWTMLLLSAALIRRRWGIFGRHG